MAKLRGLKRTGKLRKFSDRLPLIDPNNFSKMFERLRIIPLKFEEQFYLKANKKFKVFRLLEL